MRNFVDVFGNLLTREQIKSLIYRFENDGLIVTTGVGRWTVYKLPDKIDDRQNILKQFQFHIEA
jgi:hypothetical protein